MQALFSYAELAEIAYIAAAAGIALTPAQQSLAVQAVALLENPAAWTDYDTYGDDIDALVAATSDALLTTEIPPPEVGMDSEITLFPGNMTVVVGNPIVNAVNASTRGNFTSQQSPNINGNSRRAFRYMAAGDWDLRLTAVTLSNGCSLQLSIVASDSTIITPTAFNLRTAGTVFNATFDRSFTLPSSGLTEIFLGVGAGSTGGFADLLQLLEMWRTS